MALVNQRSNEGSTPTWAIRAVQIDLARQRERVSAVNDFMRFAAEWGFNTVVLYLEGVVRTKHFPYRPKRQTMSRSAIGKIVDAAGGLGLDVVPAFNAPGHAEHFLECDELAHLANTAPGIGKAEFDPSNPDVYAFLADYIGELSELFPGQHMHVGCDEAWRFGRDPVSRQRQTRGESWDRLFLEHIRRMREIALGCNKRPWIWADMLEFFTDDTLAEIPRDIVMVNWHYVGDTIERHGPQGHFNNRQRRDWFAVYQELGLDAIVAPIGDSIFATQRATDWARRYPVMGGLQTLWEMATVFLPSVKTQIAVTGRLWAQPQLDFETTVSTVIERLYPSLSAIERGAVRLALDDALWLNRQVTPIEALRSGRLNQNEVRHLHAIVLAEQALNNAESNAQDNCDEELELLFHLRTRLRYQIVAANMQSLLAEQIDPRDGLHVDDDTELMDWCRSELVTLQHWFEESWRALRPRLPMGEVEGYIRRVLDELESTVAKIQSIPVPHRTMLHLDLSMIDGYAAPVFRIELKPSGGNWVEIFHGSIKSHDLAHTHYAHWIPVPWEHDGDVCLHISLEGYGCASLRYAQLIMADRRLTPVEVVSEEGEVVGGRDVLRDNIFACELGARDVAATLIRQRETDTSRIELLLRRQPPIEHEAADHEIAASA